MVDIYRWAMIFIFVSCRYKEGTVLFATAVLQHIQFRFNQNYLDELDNSSVDENSVSLLPAACSCHFKSVILIVSESEPNLGPWAIFKKNIR